MKKTYLLVAALMLFVFSTNVSGQFSFSVSPGIHLNGAQFGYRINEKITPYFSIQYLKAGLMQSYSQMEWDYDLNAPALDEDSREMKGSVLIPTLGVKFAVINKEKLQGYVTAGLSKPIVNAEFKYDGEVEEELEEILDGISLFGLQGGFGAEYFFDTNFSIGGEFGLAYMKFALDHSYETDYWNPDTGTYVDTTADVEMNVNVMPTYSKVSLNFYF